MPEHLCITVRFLGGAFHGRADQGEPEWPPSPLRLFQALVAAAARQGDGGGGLQAAAPALRWLETQGPPMIVAPRGQPGAKYRMYVPDNVGDLLAGKWARGDDGIIKRSEKDVRPIRLEDGAAVHYAWPLPGAAEGEGDFAAVRATLFMVAASVSRLGWGVDLVAGGAAILSAGEWAALPGRRWRPARGGTNLRVPATGTLADLERRHAAFLARTAGGRFAPVPPLAVYALAGYADETAPADPAFAAFSLLQPDASGYRLYEPARDAMRVAGMLRHAAADPALGRALGWDAERVRRTVLGHAGPPTDGAHVPVAGPRLAFLPLPSVEFRPGRGGGRSSAVGGIRRVLVTGTGGLESADLRALARLLSGQTLTDEASGATVAMLSRLPDADPMVNRYVRPSAAWTTVTPVILPGNDDRGGYRRRLSRHVSHDRQDTPEPDRASGKWAEWLAKLDARTDALLRRAIRHAGYAPELAARAGLEWRDGGFLPGVALASRHDVPQKLRRFRRLHVRIAWRDAAGDPVEMLGPLCLGGGRFAGLGVFCAVKP